MPVMSMRSFYWRRENMCGIMMSFMKVSLLLL